MCDNERYGQTKMDEVMLGNINHKSRVGPFL